MTSSSWWHRCAVGLGRAIRDQRPLADHIPGFFQDFFLATCGAPMVYNKPNHELAAGYFFYPFLIPRYYYHRGKPFYIYIHNHFFEKEGTGGGGGGGGGVKGEAVFYAQHSELDNPNVRTLSENITGGISCQNGPWQIPGFVTKKCKSFLETRKPITG